MIISKLCQTPRGLAGLLFAVLYFLLSTQSTAAGSFSVSPLKVVLSANKKVVSLTVRNRGIAAASIQLQTVEWRQDDNGNDVYTPAKILLATPPMFTLPPGEIQVIRAGLRRLPDAREELAFRLYLQEIPAPVDGSFQGLQVALRLGVPVFVQPTSETAPKLQWQAKRLDNGKLQIQASNDGTAHAKLGGVSLVPENGGSMEGKVTGYLLPGSTRHWDLEPVFDFAPGDQLTVSARVNGKTSSVRVRVD